MPNVLKAMRISHLATLMSLASGKLFQNDFLSPWAASWVVLELAELNCVGNGFATFGLEGVA